MKKKSSQSQLILLLDAIEERGGAARAREVYDRVAEKVDLSAEDRVARITISGHSYNGVVTLTKIGRIETDSAA